MNNQGYSYNYNAQNTNYGMSLSYDQYLSRTFRWMTVGLLMTFAVAYTVAYTNLIYMVHSLYLPLTLVEFAMVFVLSARVNSLKVNTARMLFLGYSALNGLVLSIYFVMFDMSTMVMAFLAAALYFGIMAVYGAKTSRDLMGWGTMLTAGLVAMLVCSFVGLLFGMSFMTSMLYSAVGLGLFMLITARDVQMLQHSYQWFSGDAATLEKSAIFGALSLYLDFINIFLYVVRMFASSRDD